MWSSSSRKVWNAHQYRPLAVKRKSLECHALRGWETDLIMENILRLEHQKNNLVPKVRYPWA